jgi:hypothetical protein
VLQFLRSRRRYRRPLSKSSATMLMQFEISAEFCTSVLNASMVTPVSEAISEATLSAFDGGSGCVGQGYVCTCFS